MTLYKDKIFTHVKNRTKKLPLDLQEGVFKNLNEELIV
jgi:hypothetical protein